MVEWVIAGLALLMFGLGVEQLYNLSRQRRERRVAKEVAMGLRQAFTALHDGPASDDMYDRRNRATAAILKPLVPKATVITGKDYVCGPDSQYEIRPPLDEDPWQ